MHDPKLGRWAVATLFFLNGFVTGSWAPEIPVLVTRFALSETALGLLIAVFGMGAILAMPVCGYLIGFFGSRRVVQTTSILCAASPFGIAFAPDLPSLVAALVFFGAALGSMDVAMNSNAVVVERRLQRAIMSSSHGFWSLGAFAGAGTGGLVVQHWGHIVHLTSVAVLSLALALAAARWLVAERSPSVKALNGGRGGLPRSPLIYLTGLIGLFCMMSEGAVLDWAALYLRQEMGASIATASLAFTGFSGAMALMRFAGDAVRNRLGAVKTMRVSAIVASTGMLAAGLVSSPLLATLAFAFAGLGIANMVPIVFSAAGNQSGVPSAAGVSVATTIGYSGMLAAPSLVGFIAERTGFTPVFIGLAVLLAVVLTLSGLVRPADDIAAEPAHG